MSNYRRNYIDLSEDEMREIKKEILKVGTDNFKIEEHNITYDCYDILVQDIMCYGINNYEEDDDYWERRESEEMENLHHYDDDYYDD